MTDATYRSRPINSWIPGEVSVLAQLLQHLAQHLPPHQAREALRKVQEAAPHSQMRLEQCFFLWKQHVKKANGNEVEGFFFEFQVLFFFLFLFVFVFLSGAKKNYAV